MEDNLRVLKPFIRGSFLIILSMILGVMIAKKYLSYTIPMYESTTKLKLANSNEGIESSNLFKDFDVFASANKIAAEIEVLKSTILINKTLDSLDFDVEIYRKGKVKSVELYDNSPFQIKGDFNNPKAFDKKYGLKIRSDKYFEIILPENDQTIITGKFGELVSFKYGRFILSLNQKYIASKPDLDLIDQYEFEFLSRQKLVNKISKYLDIVAVDKDVAIIRINFKSPIPAKASLFVDMLAKTYIEDYIETKYKAAETTVRFLDKQLVEVSRKLSRAESNIENYRNAKKITNIRQETETDLRKISQLKIQQTNVKMNLMAIKSLNEYIQNGKDNFLELAPNFETFTDLLSTEIIKSIKALQSEKKDLLLIYTDKEERVKVIDHKISDLTSYLVESVANTKNNLEIKYLNLSKDIEEFEKVFVTVPEKEKMITVMNREFEIYQKIYISLNEKKIEAGIAKAAKISFHRIINPAKSSNNPVSPNKPIITIVAAIMGMFGSIVLIYLVHLAKAKVNDRQTIESNSGIPIAMVTPKLKNTFEIENHFLQEAGQLEIKDLINTGSILCISSFKLKEGALFNSFYLAKALAQQNRKVLVIDVDDAMQNGTNNNKEPVNICENMDSIALTNSEFKSYTQLKMKGFIEKLKEPYDVILILNEELGGQKSLMMMSIATTNLVSVDTRLTQAKKIVEIDLLKDEFDLASVHFILNRYNYNPNIIKEIFIGLKKIFKYKKRKLWLRSLQQLLVAVIVIIPIIMFSGDIMRWGKSIKYGQEGEVKAEILAEENINQELTIQENRIDDRDKNIISSTNDKDDQSVKSETSEEIYHLIAASFKYLKNAENLAESYRKYNYNPIIIFQPKMNWHLVSIASYAQKTTAELEAEKVSKVLKTKIFILKKTSD
jgi:uncharacterized protein involved in exopolysaccharide biosynthesis